MVDDLEMWHFMDNERKICGFVLAAGEGRRMRPYTSTVPKALLPFCGIPLLRILIERLFGLNLPGIVVNSCYLGEQVKACCMSMIAEYGWDIRISEETRLLNHGGGLRQGIKLFPEATDFLVHNVDIVADCNLETVLDKHISENNDVTAVLIQRPAAKHGVVVDDRENILHFRDFEHGMYAFSGIHVFKREVLDKYLPLSEEAPDVIECYHHAIADGAKVRGIVMPSDAFWADLGTPSEYIRAHGLIADSALSYNVPLKKLQLEQARRKADLEAHGVSCIGALGLGTNLMVASGSQLHDVVVWDNVTFTKPLMHAKGILTGNCNGRPVDGGNRQCEPSAGVWEFLGISGDRPNMELLQKQGSGRNYYRIYLPNGKTVIWHTYNPERRENSAFAAIDDFMSRLGIRVPNVLLHLIDSCELVTEDLGAFDLQTFKGEKERYLMQAVEQIARLHVLGSEALRYEELPLQKTFTKGLYDWERDYFRENFLENCVRDSSLWSVAANEYLHLRHVLLKQPLVPIHRDFQSANIKINDNKVWLIDFQGMRLGAAAYDLASLLYDPYQCHPAILRKKLWSEYCRQVELLCGTPPQNHLLPYAAIQRLMQALGAFGKLWLKDGLSWYQPYIVPALTMLKQAAEEAGFQNFAKLSECAKEKLSIE